MQSLDQSQVTEDEYTPQNYHRLARIMSRERNLAIFRRFDEINLLQLMALQAEIVELQGRFEASCQEDDAAGLMYSRSFHELRRSQQRDERIDPDGETGSNMHSQETITEASANPSPHLQRDLLQRLGDRMEKYITELSRLRSPPKSQLQSLQDWLVDSKGGHSFLKDAGFEFFTWRNKNTEAYISLQSAQEESYVFSRFMTRVIARIFHRVVGEKMKVGTVIDEEASLVSYSDSKLSRASNVVALVVSSVLPVMTIFVLNTVNTTNQRIGLTMLFTAVFAVLLAVFSNAKSVEIFGATAT
ncbi:hypothetical protein SLS64_012482 [Diaporthe eres]|uniref:DUF6594 domain-containing protein n=1 Tax=Diaporthe eres TaxID=83184 RepID=A0ABR1P7B5_DIAER